MQHRQITHPQIIAKTHAHPLTELLPPLSQPEQHQRITRPQPIAKIHAHPLTELLPPLSQPEQHQQLSEHPQDQFLKVVHLFLLYRPLQKIQITL